MSRKSKYSFVAIAVAFIMLSLANVACDGSDNPCTNCTGEGTAWDSNSKSFVQPTPSIGKQVKQVVEPSQYKEIDRIGMGRPQAELNAFVDNCHKMGGFTQQPGPLSMTCVK